MPRQRVSAPAASTKSSIIPRARVRVCADNWADNDQVDNISPPLALFVLGDEQLPPVQLVCDVLLGPGLRRSPVQDSMLVEAQARDVVRRFRWLLRDLSPQDWREGASPCLPLNRRYLPPSHGGAELDYDRVDGEVFETREAFEAATVALSVPEIAAEIAEDEEGLFDRSGNRFCTIKEHELILASTV